MVLELASGKMAFISHDTLWEREYEDFEECVVRTPLTFDEFWVQASRDHDFPRDSYDAEKRWSSTADPSGATG